MADRRPSTFVSGFHDETQTSKMSYSRLGNTDMVVSKISLGGAAFSGLYGEFEDAEAIGIILEAFKSGVNYIDTAPFYGQGRSEALIGKGLKTVPRNAYYISTKVGRYSNEWCKMFDYSREKILSGFEHSRSLLGVDYTDAVVVHDIEFGDIKQILEEALPAAKELKDQGKTRYIGISGYPLSVLREVVEKSTVKIDIVLSYARDTLLDATLKDFMPFFKSKGIGVINASPVTQGLLTNKGPEKWQAASDTVKELCSKAAKYCEENGVELGNLAVYHVISTPRTTTCLVACITKDILRSNLRLLFEGLTPKEKEVLKYLKEKYFTLKENLHFEGVEVETYRKKMNQK